MSEAIETRRFEQPDQVLDMTRDCSPTISWLRQIQRLASAG
jgi:hypothetical protein